MSNRYNFRINTPEPSSEDVGKRKNFDALLHRYREGKKGADIIRLRRSLMVAAASVAAGILTWFALETLPLPGSYEQRAAAHFAALPFIDPPLGVEMQPEFARFAIDAAQGGAHEGKNGARLNVPAEVFQDETGNTVEGRVDIHYREMHDAVELFLSGIPMHYDSAGVEYQMESAGMLEIYAEQNGKRLLIRPGRAIEVELVSEISAPNMEEAIIFDVYRLDTTLRNWVYEDVNRMVIMETYFPELPEDHPLCQVQESFQMELAILESAERLALSDLEQELAIPAPPLRPQQHNGDDFVFDFDLSSLLQSPERHNLSPEQLALLQEGTLWQLHPTEAEKRNQLARQWDNIQLQPINNRDFRLTLFSGAEQLSVMVNPVLSGPNFDKALAEYHAAMARYEELVAATQTIRQQRRDSILERFAAERNILHAQYDDAWAAAQTEHPPIRHKVLNRFSVNRLGVWTCNRPLKAASNQVLASFEDETGASLHNRTGYIVDRNRNTVTRFYAGRTAKIPVDPHGSQSVWMLAGRQKLAVARAAALKELDPDAGRHDIVMELVDLSANARDALYSSL
jgi:hypothetical protein